MKRLIYCLCFFLLFTGCGSKTLKCSYKKNISDSSISNEDLKISFKDDRISKLTMNIDVTLSDTDNVTRESIQSSVDNSFGFYKNMAGVNYSSNVRDDGFDVKISIIFSKLNKSEKEKISLVNPEKNYEQIKQEFESNGFICE